MKGRERKILGLLSENTGVSNKFLSFSGTLPYSCSTGCTSTTSGVSSCTTTSTGTPVKISPITPILKTAATVEKAQSLLKAGSLTPVKRSCKTPGTPLTRVQPVHNTYKRHPAAVFCTPVRRGNNVTMNCIAGMRSCPVSPSRSASCQLKLQSKSTPKIPSHLKMQRYDLTFNGISNYPQELRFIRN